MNSVLAFLESHPALWVPLVVVVAHELVHLGSAVLAKRYPSLGALLQSASSKADVAIDAAAEKAAKK